MLRSAARYLRFFSKNLLHEDGKILKRDFKRWLTGKLLPADRPPEVMKTTGEVVNYLLRARENSGDKGFGSYHLGSGWGSSYPETTGYIIPSLLDHYHLVEDEYVYRTATEAAAWLVEIQRPSGGWQGGRIGEGKPEVVFNTAQVVRGLLRIYQETGQDTYLASAIKACDWLVEQQDPEGYWKKHALMEAHRVYDSFVDVPLVAAWQITGEERYREAAVRNLDWIVSDKQQENGWFEDCDNTIRHNDRPILHTIAYTIDGLIDCGMMLNIKEYIDAARKPADHLRDRFNQRGILHGRFNRKWQGTEDFICTGGAQMAIAWLKMDGIFPNEGYFNSAEKMISLLAHIQVKEEIPAKGSLTGSYPLWGRYEPFACPNWASKFFLDALLLYHDRLHKNSL